MITIKTDTEEFSKYMAGLISISKRSVQEVVKEQAVGLAKELMFQTQPYGDSQQSKNKGVNAVKRALILSITPADQLYEPFTKNEKIKQMVKKRDMEGLQALNKNIPGLEHYRFNAFDPNDHRSYKLKHNYDIRKYQGIVTFDKSSWNRYTKSKQDLVGLVKSGWGKVLAAFGSRMPAWIRRHVNSNYGTLKMDIDADSPTPSITISNIEGKGDQRVVEEAMRRQVNKMKLNFEKRLQHFLKTKSLNVEKAQID